MNWQLQEAKARFSEVVDRSLDEGPQIITRRGKETAVLVSLEEWQRQKRQARPELKELLLDEQGRFEITVPQRGRMRRRAG